MLEFDIDMDQFAHIRLLGLVAVETMLSIA